MEILAWVVAVLVLLGTVVGIVAYKPYRNWLIATKGFDADTRLSAIVSGAALIVALLAMLNEEYLPAILLAAAVLVAAVLFRIRKVGLLHAIGISVVQGFSVFWVVSKTIVRLAYRMVSGSVEVSNKVAVDLSKQQAWEKYEKAMSDANAIYSSNPEAARDIEAQAERQLKDDKHMIDVIHGSDAKDN